MRALGCLLTLVRVTRGSFCLVSNRPLLRSEGIAECMHGQCSGGDGSSVRRMHGSAKVVSGIADMPTDHESNIIRLK